MASLVTAACRLSARAARGRVIQEGAGRGYQTSSPWLAASNFTMPALSPTMTEGNIAAWKVKEGDSYSAGDVLLEIETDKATMDVEAQEEGIMMKITQQDGAKSVQVGARIAVMAEPGDDISSLEMPANAEPIPAPEAPNSSPTLRETSSQSKDDSLRKAVAISSAPQSYPLLPAVKQLMKQKGINESEVSNMTPTGPKGRLLKGDVLAYLGVIAQDKPEGIQTRFEKLSHLDLSNVKVAPPKAPVKKLEANTKPTTSPVVDNLRVSMPISLAPALEVRRRLGKMVGIDMPLSTLIARATEMANENLPLATNHKPSANELFNQVLGLNTVAKSSKGFYLPQVTALPQSDMKTPRASWSKKVDIIDMLAAHSMKKTTKPRQEIATSLATGSNIFTLSVPKPEEKRAKVFLERVKMTLENEPGQLLFGA